MTRHPVAYIRRSSADDDNPGDVSREAQEAAVRDLAHRDGHNGNLQILVDWDRSADEAKESKRAAFLEMLADIEGGNVSEVYAYALDRLYRSMRTFVRLTDAARKHDVRIVTLREGVLGGDGSPMAQAFAQITAVFSELELNTAKARARGATAARAARGDAFGQPGYGWQHVRDGRGAIVRIPDPERPLEPVLAAYREAGSIVGACRLLMDRKVPAPHGGERWGMSSLTRIIEANAPEMLPRRNPRGQRIPVRLRRDDGERRTTFLNRGAILAQLVRCPFCETMLTPNAARRQLYCSHGARDRASHPRYVASAPQVERFVKREAARLRFPFDAVEMASTIEGRREALTAKLDAAGDNYAAGAWTRDKRDRVIASVKAEMDRLDAEQEAITLPPTVDFTWPPDRLNAVLRTLFGCVRLDKRMRPVRAERLLPPEFWA